MKYYNYEFSDNYLLKDIELKLLSLYFEEKVWIHANPAMYANKQNLLAKYYEKNINSESIINTLSNLLFSNYTRGIILHANKGAGKTFISNYFLNTHTKTLNSQNITWIRVDIAKIYQNYFLSGMDISLDDYLYAQIVFVYFRYKQSYTSNYSCTITSFDEVFAKIDESILQKRASIDQEQFNNIKNIALTTPCFCDGIEGKPIHNQHTETIALSIFELLKEQNLQIVLFVDGIDNIDYQTNFFNKLKQDLKDFFKIHQNKFKNIVLVSRTENYHSIINTDINNYWDNTRVIEYGGQNIHLELKPINFKEFIEQTSKKFPKDKPITRTVYNESIIKLLKIWINLEEVKKTLDIDIIEKIDEIINCNKKDEIINFIKGKDIFFKNIKLKNKLKESFGINVIENLEKLLQYNSSILQEYFDFAISLLNLTIVILD